MAEGAPGAAPAWRRIDELAELVGAYSWLEHRLFELTGAWASGGAPGGDAAQEAELRVWCAAASRRHGALAARWAERLPVRAGVDPAELVRAPAGPLDEALESLMGGSEGLGPVGALVATVLPRVGGIYGSHLGSASPVREGSVLEVLVEARRELAGEIRGGRALLEGLPEAAARGATLGEEIERAFDATRVFPAVRPS